MATVTSSTTLSLTLEVDHDETLSQGDFIIVEGTSLVAQISHTETAGGSYSAEATFVGEFPDKPIPEGESVVPAPADLVRSALRLPEAGIHLGQIPNLDSPVYLNPNALMEKQIGIFGRTGSGKSYSAAVLVEELLDHDMPVLIIDPHGEYTSLQISTDGSPSDYPVKHYADREWVPEADEELDVQAMNMTECIAPGQATIIDLHGVGDDRERIVAELLEEAFLARKREQIPGVKVLIEEAHNFATSKKNEAQSVIRNIAKEGRKFQFTLGIVSQRPSGIDHNVRAQLQSMALHKLTDDTDIKKTIDITEGVDSSWDTQIQRLDTGKCILAGDLIASPTFVNVRERKTMHQSDDDDGLFSARDHAIDPEALEEHQSELAEYVEDATADELRQHVIELTRRRGLDAEGLENYSGGEAELSEELDELRSKVTSKENQIKRLEERLEAKDQRIEELEDQLAQQPAEANPETQNTTTEGQLSSGNNQQDEVKTTDELLEELGDVKEEGASEWDTRPSEPRSKEQVLRNKHVVRHVKEIWDDLEGLSQAERKTLKHLENYGPKPPEEAFERATGPSTTESAEEVISNLSSKGFIARNSRNTYIYVLDDKVRSRVYEILHEEEIPYVIEAVEEKL